MKRTAIAAILLLIAFSAQAEENEAAQWRVGASASFADFERDDGLISDSSVGFKLNAQYKFNRWFGVEGGYYVSADFSQDLTPNDPGGNTDQSFKGVSLHAIGYIPLSSDDIELFVKVGYYDFDIELAQEGTISQTGSDDGLAVGFGTSIYVHDQLSVRTEFDWYGTQDSALWAVSLGVEYRF